MGGPPSSAEEGSAGKVPIVFPPVDDTCEEVPAVLDSGDAPAPKTISFCGKEVSESSVRKVFVRTSAFFVALNVLGLPFVLPKLRLFLGAPFVPMKRRYVDTLFDRVLPAWVNSRPGVVYQSEKTSLSLAGIRLVDFGSGDGRIITEAAKRGIHATGYELNPYLVWLSRQRLAFAKPLVGPAEIRWANAWKADLRNTDVLTVYGRPGDKLMEKIATKCEKELPKNAAVVSHLFDMPGWERILVQDVDGVKLYDLSRRDRLKRQS